MYIANVENSEIDVSGIRTVLVQGDSAYPSIRFVLDPSLTGLSWRVRGTYLSSNIAVTSPELVATETASSVALDWSVASDFTAYNGDMQLSLVGANELGTVITKALGEITIQKDYSLGEHQTITLDLFEQLMAQADATISKYPYIDEASGNWFVWNPTLGVWEDTGESANGAPSYWYTGTTITGTETTPTAFPSSGITQARYGDMYLNADTSNVYRCTLGGAAAIALWSYQTNIKGAQGIQGEQGVQGEQGIQGDPGTDGERGTQTFSGTAITGTSTTPTAYATGITLAIINDRYRNTDSGSASYQNEYVCTLGGNAATALWAYDGNVRGATGATGANGAGVPSGGTANQLIYKIDGTDYNTGWKTLAPANIGAASLDANSKVTASEASASISVYADSGTLALADAGKLVKVTKGTAATITIPLFAAVAFPVGTEIEIAQYGAGQVTVAITAGGTLYSAGAAKKTAAQYASVSIKCIAQDEWLLTGYLAL